MTCSFEKGYSRHSSNHFNMSLTHFNWTDWIFDSFQLIKYLTHFNESLTHSNWLSINSFQLNEYLTHLNWLNIQLILMNIQLISMSRLLIWTDQVFNSYSSDFNDSLNHFIWVSIQLISKSIHYLSLMNTRSKSFLWICCKVYHHLYIVS